MCVVTLGTMRIIFVGRGHKVVDSMLGFCEVFLWLLVMRRIMQNLDEWYPFLAFALGFASGNYLGMLIEQMLAMGMLHVRVITRRDTQDLVQNLGTQNLGVTCVKGQ